MIFRRLCVSLLCMAAITISAAYSEIDNRPIVIIRIDDCQSNWRTPFAGLGGVSALDYGKAKKIPITWAVIPSATSTGAAMTWAEIRDYLDTCGGEAASHSVSHAALSTQQKYIAELIEAKALIEENLSPYKCNTFLQPGPWAGDAYMDCFAKLDNPIGQAIQANYSQSMAYLGQGWHIGKPYYKYGLASVFSIDYPNSFIEKIELVLDTAAQTPGLITIITGHGVQKQGGTGAYAIPADLLKATMDKLADLRDQGKIRLMGIHEAFHTDFSDNLNQLTNSGFDVGTQDINIGWDLYAATVMVDTGGVNNSRWCMLNSSSNVRSSNLTLPPGRYEISWYQKALPDKANTGLAVCLSVSQQKNQNSFDVTHNCINWATFSSNAPILEWQKRTALALVPERLNVSQLTFQAGSTAGYGVDEINICPQQLDPAVSPSASTTRPSPTSCNVSWHTPNDPDVKSIVIRYSFTTHPTTPTSGTAFGSVPAQPGVVQQVSGPMIWTNRTYVFFSIFGVKADSSFTPPELAVVKVDTTQPSRPDVVLTTDSQGMIRANWTSSDAESTIVQYQYAVGSTCGACNIRQWTDTLSAQAIIARLCVGTSGYVSVKAQNAFGIWSEVGSKQIPSLPAATGFRQAMALYDGELVSLSGVITAVFSDRCYLEALDRSRGIKLIGNITGFKQGDPVTIQGVIGTDKGERFVDLP